MKSIEDKWWDGYDGQPVVLMDDFELDSLKDLKHKMKLWADNYGQNFGQVKGG